MENTCRMETTLHQIEPEFALRPDVGEAPVLLMDGERSFAGTVQASASSRILNWRTDEPLAVNWQRIRLTH